MGATGIELMTLLCQASRGFISYSFVLVLLVRSPQFMPLSFCVRRPNSCYVLQLREWLPAVRPSCRPIPVPLLDNLVDQAIALGKQPVVPLLSGHAFRSVARLKDGLDST